MKLSMTGGPVIKTNFSKIKRRFQVFFKTNILFFTLYYLWSLLAYIYSLDIFSVSPTHKKSPQWIRENLSERCMAKIEEKPNWIYMLGGFIIDSAENNIFFQKHLKSSFYIWDFFIIIIRNFWLKMLNTNQWTKALLAYIRSNLWLSRDQASAIAVVFANMQQALWTLAWSDPGTTIGAWLLIPYKGKIIFQKCKN